MKKNEVTRDYKMADASLCIIAGEKHHFMQRDAADFLLYNIPAPEVAIFRNDITAFEGFTTDVEMEALKIDTTNIKDAIAENVKVAIREIMNRG